MGRTFAIGDIHGCLTALQTLVRFANVSDDDLVVTLGDYVDRGPDSAGVLEWVIDRHSKGRLIPLRGNHEIMMLDALARVETRDSWLAVGGREALASYRWHGYSGEIDDIPERHRKFMRLDCLPYHETDTHFFVHANAYPDTELADQPDFMLFWEKWQGTRMHCSGKMMICGHSSMRDGLPGVSDGSICIDTRVYGHDGWLTCLDVYTGEYWQANEDSETRSGWIADLEPDGG